MDEATALVMFPICSNFQYSMSLPFSFRPRSARGGGGGEFPPFLGGGAQLLMKRFCKNVGSKGSKNNVKGGHQDQKSKRKLLLNPSKWSNDRFWWNIIPTSSLALNVIETDWGFFLQKGVNEIELGIEKGPNGITKCQTNGKSRGSSLPPSSMGVYLPSLFSPFNMCYFFLQS